MTVVSLEMWMNLTFVFIQHQELDFGTNSSRHETRWYREFKKWILSNIHSNANHVHVAYIGRDRCLYDSLDRYLSQPRT